MKWTAGGESLQGGAAIRILSAVRNGPQTGSPTRKLLARVSKHRQWAVGFWDQFGHQGSSGLCSLGFISPKADSPVVSHSREFLQG